MSRALIPLGVLAVAMVVATAKAGNMCAMEQICYNGGVDSPCHPIPSYRPPVPMDFGAGTKLACPEYKDSACCTADQNRALNFNFMLIGFTFGKFGPNGCEACAQNLRKFWCDFTCGPNQAEFLHPIAIVNMSDPANQGHLATALKVRLDIKTDFACNMYQSCHSTGKAREFAAMKTCNSFLDYMGEEQAIAHGTYIEFNYTDAPLAMSYPPAQCQNFTTTTGEQSSCPCSSCAASCSASGGLSPTVTEDVRQLAVISPTHGANWVMIAVVYCIIAALSGALVFYRYDRKRRSQRGPSGSPPLVATGVRA